MVDNETAVATNGKAQTEVHSCCLQVLGSAQRKLHHAERQSHRVAGALS